MTLKVPKRVALVALGPSNLHYIQEVDSLGDRHAKYDETWTVNTFCNVIQSDRLFHMDNIAVQRLRAKAGNKKVEGMLRAMKDYKGPIITSILDEEYPQCVQYPLFEIVGKYQSLYFNNTVAYAVAYALYIGVEALTVFGVDFTWPDIHKAESGRGCVEYWLGRCEHAGMKVAVCTQSTLKDARLWDSENIPIYGYDGYRLRMFMKDGKPALQFSEASLPTAEEMEKRYYHGPLSKMEMGVANNEMAHAGDPAKVISPPTTGAVKEAAE